MRQEDLLHTLRSPFSEGIARVSALSSSVEDAEVRWLGWMATQPLPLVLLRPPQPWFPLAPLVHLCAYHGVTPPPIQSKEIDIPSLWLGASVCLSRWFLRFGEVLQASPTVAWIEGADLDAPLWGEFLRMACLGYLKLPIHFVFLSKQGQTVHAGMQRLRVEPPFVQHKNTSQYRAFSRDVAERWGQRLSRQAADYLGQALVFGDRLDVEAMRRLSRANHIRRRAELRRCGVLDQDGAFAQDRLRFAAPIFARRSERWHRAALRFCESTACSATTKLWLYLAEKNQRSSWVIEEDAVVRGLLELGTPAWAAALAVCTGAGVSERVRLCAYLLAHREAEQPVPNADAMGLSAPYRQMALIRSIGANKEEGIAALNTSLQQLSVLEAPWAAALAALEMARWHLGQGRLRMVFQLLSPFKESDSWAVRWWSSLLFAEVYCRLERHDLSRNAIEQAIAVVPKPMSPVLVGEIRMATARLLGASGESEEAEVQLVEARDAFRAAGDGIRLGRYLMAVGELFWQREAFEDARGLFGKSIDLFRRYRDGIGLWEAQLKLGLVLNLAPANALLSRS